MRPSSTPSRPREVWDRKGRAPRRGDAATSSSRARPSKADLKARVAAAVDRRAADIVEAGLVLETRPELGYRELGTANAVASWWDRLGVPYRAGIALTGVIARLAGGRAGQGRAQREPLGPERAGRGSAGRGSTGRGTPARVAVLGELDALRLPGHPAADPATGAAHACGHHAQLANLLGVALGLLESGVLPHLDGEVLLMAVPAEEPVELEYKLRLMGEGKIVLLGGKQEFIRLGHFEGVGAAMLCHLDASPDEAPVAVGGRWNGFLAKHVRYLGREAHAGSQPDLGVNALNAAVLGLLAVGAQRETFRDEERVRVHPIVTRGGDVVNIVPADVRVETYVRAASVQAMLDASGKVNRALEAGAAAVGAEVRIREIPGYLPFASDPLLGDLFAANARELLGPEAVGPESDQAGSTDLGDVAHLLPVIQPAIAAATGGLHTTGFRIVNPELAYVFPAKAMAMTVVDLLADGAEGLGRLTGNFTPRHDRQSYLALWKELMGVQGE